MLHHYCSINFHFDPPTQCVTYIPTYAHVHNTILCTNVHWFSLFLQRLHRWEIHIRLTKIMPIDIKETLVEDSKHILIITHSSFHIFTASTCAHLVTFVARTRKSGVPQSIRFHSYSLLPTCTYITCSLISLIRKEYQIIRSIKYTYISYSIKCW